MQNQASEKLDQVIYTRCKPHRDLKNNGQVVHSDGFGIFSMNRELLNKSQSVNFDMLQTRLSRQNGAKEGSAAGLFHSYEYYPLGEMVYAISYEVARPLCREPRKSGQSHRPGTYIKQCLVGEITGYPFNWFGTTVWDAWKKSENSYYLDEPSDGDPEFLAQVDNRPVAVGKIISLESVRAFVSQGRRDMVKAGMWFLLHEYDKSENDRKVLLIRDIPENVELWVAAFEYGLPDYLARKIPFSTNVSRLSTQTDQSLFYYTDIKGNVSTVLNRSVQQFRHPYAMIAGFHPKDNYCSTVRAMPTSNFAIIDGENLTTSIQADDTIRSSYYSDLIRYDGDIRDFCEYVMPKMPLKEICSKIAELYEAYTYLLDENHKVDSWQYEETLSAFCKFNQYGISDDMKMNEYLFTEAC